MPIDGTKLQELRKRAGLTQSELAEVIGMTSTSIGLMERGDAKIERRTELAVRHVVQKPTVFAERITRKVSSVDWRDDDGDQVAELYGFKVRLIPKSGGRWRIVATHIESGYSPSWPVWEDTLEDAKISAVLHVQHGLMDIAEAASD